MPKELSVGDKAICKSIEGIILYLDNESCVIKAKGGECYLFFRREVKTAGQDDSCKEAARRGGYLLDAGWIGEDGRYYPCMQGEHHGEAAVREHLVDAGPAYEDLYDEERGELDSDALSDMVEQAMDLGNVRVGGHPFTEFDAMWDNVHTRSNIARAIRDNPELQRVDIEFHRPEHTYMRDLQPQEALRWMQSGERPEQGGKVGACPQA